MKLVREIEICDKLLAKRTKYSSGEAKTEKFATLTFKGLLDEEKEVEAILKIKIPIKYLKDFNKILNLSDFQKKIELSLKKSKQVSIEKFSLTEENLEEMENSENEGAE